MDYELNEWKEFQIECQGLKMKLKKKEKKMNLRREDSEWGALQRRTWHRV